LTLRQTALQGIIAFDVRFDVKSVHEEVGRSHVNVVSKSRQQTFLVCRDFAATCKISFCHELAATMTRTLPHLCRYIIPTFAATMPHL
jgi:hypothetical protein